MDSVRHYAYISGMIVLLALRGAVAAGQVAEKEQQDLKGLKEYFDATYEKTVTSKEMPETLDEMLYAGLQVVHGLNQQHKTEEAGKYAGKLEAIAEHVAKVWGGVAPPPPYDVSGMAFEETGRMRDAYRCEKKNVEWRSAHDRVFDYHKLGILAWKAGDAKEGENLLRKEIAKSPHDLPAYLDLSTLLVEANGDKEEAITILQLGIVEGIKELRSYSTERPAFVNLLPPGKKMMEEMYGPACGTDCLPAEATALIKERLREGYTDVTDIVRAREIRLEGAMVDILLKRCVDLMASTAAKKPPVPQTPAVTN